LFFAGTADGDVHGYLAADGEAVGTIYNPDGAVTAIAAAPAHPQEVIAIGTARGELWLCGDHEADPQGYFCLQLPSAVSALAWTYWPDGWELLAIGLSDGAILVWDPRTTALPDGTWYVDDPAAIRAVAPATGVAITALCWSPVGDGTLVAGAANGFVSTFDVEQASQTHSFSTPQLADTALATGELDGRPVIAASGSRFRVWDIATRTPVVVSDEAGRGRDELLFGDLDGHTIVLQPSYDGVRVWDPLQLDQEYSVAVTRPSERQGFPIALTRLPPEAIGAVNSDLADYVIAFGRLAGHATLATATEAGAITLADLGTGAQRSLQWYNSVHSLAIGPDSLLAIGDPQGYTVIQIH
jgi:WD40 repeat protein